MTLTTDKNGTQLTVHLSGELNTMTAPELTALLDKELAGVKALTLDFTECDYVSFAVQGVYQSEQLIISGYEAIFQVCSPLRGFHFPFAAFAKGRKRLYF